MPLTAQFAVNFPNAPTAAGTAPVFSPGQSAPTISLTLTNPGTTAVSATGVDVVFSDRSLNARPSGTPLPLPVGANQTASIPAGASVTFGPFPMSTWTSASLNPAALIAPDTSPFGVLPAFPMFEVFVAGTVYGSDGSANTIGRARMFVGFANQPSRGFLGGNADFGATGDSPLLSVVA